eukprot:CAMPEP_0172669816 /NCGR_PEP_ID=MMETSP1074-20121228/9920_1 /TAXON_ID=2916 /ORGANISM="Ceratium fusus, Strain PA161109" /LENGTH=92 /DNA_ID=CAMNT_0013486647 /DNA_START=271 /DNA_END=549 /DNA_ORIENTATION=+
MKQSVNGGSAVKNLMDKFLVVHATGDEGDPWKEAAKSTATYVPQTYWFGSDGSHLDIPGTMDQYRYFFSDDASLANAMQRALEKQPRKGEEL